MTTFKIHTCNKYSKVAKGIKDIYEEYVEGNEEPVDYELFKNIIYSFNEGVVDLLVEGYEVNLGYQLAALSIVRVKRDPRTQRVDWAASMKLKNELLESGEEIFDSKTGEGEKWLVYYTDDKYFRWRWNKEQCRIKNKYVYRFDAARGNNGKSPKEKLTDLLKNDDLAYLRFKQLNGYL
jgi:hypothetical protein